MKLTIRKILLLLTSSKTRNRIQSMDGSVEHFFRVLPTDLDENLHMNNARYLNYMELGRWDMMIRTGFLKHAFKHKFVAPVSAINVIYRRSLRLFQKFKVQSRIVSWTDHKIFIQHQVTSEAQVYALALVECRILSKRGPLSLEGVVRALGLEPGSGFNKQLEEIETLTELSRQILRSV